MRSTPQDPNRLDWVAQKRILRVDAANIGINNRALRACAVGRSRSVSAICESYDSYLATWRRACVVAVRRFRAFGRVWQRRS